MNRNRFARFAVTVLGVAGLSCVTRALLAQRGTADSVAIEIAAALHDTAVVSPITGVRVPADAVSLAADAIKGSTVEARRRLARALSASGTTNTLITQLLVSLARMRAQPSSFRVELAVQAF